MCQKEGPYCGFAHPPCLSKLAAPHCFSEVVLNISCFLVCEQSTFLLLQRRANLTALHFTKEEHTLSVVSLPFNCPEVTRKERWHVQTFPLCMSAGYFTHMGKKFQNLWADQAENLDVDSFKYFWRMEMEKCLHWHIFCCCGSELLLEKRD